jgi:hypothetical protein
MANYTETTNISPTRFVPVSSRYASSEVIYYTEKKLITFSTYKKTQNKDEENPTLKTKFYVVSPGMEYRPDLVSVKAYGTPDFWWRIMEYNNIKDIFDFKAGLNLVLPNTLLR